MSEIQMSEFVMREVLDLFPEEEAAKGVAKSKRLKDKLAPFNLAAYLEADHEPFFQSGHGALFDGDCLAVLPHIKADSIDTVFADPPFNLDKKYGAKAKDNLPEHKYVEWCKAWLDECIRVLKPGGSLFLYNLPRWNIVLEDFHGLGLDRHDAVTLTGLLATLGVDSEGA
ncbi:DNA methylase N-4/N-6 domain-containing protein [Stutzerimonas stutzeri TS44]|nr:DNA methylase N-4/N-6 domain-containing protein [Stutzerimonas stutzeri TS44]